MNNSGLCAKVPNATFGRISLDGLPEIVFEGTNPTAWIPLPGLTNTLTRGIDSYSSTLGPSGLIALKTSAYRGNLDIAFVNPLGGGQRTVELGAFDGDILLPESVLTLTVTNNDIGAASFNTLLELEYGAMIDFRMRKIDGNEMTLTVRRTVFALNELT